MPVGRPSESSGPLHGEGFRVLGGMVAQEFAASFPGRAERALVFAAPAALGAGAIAWSHTQRRALSTGGSEGLRLAREIPMLNYRTPTGPESRFSRRTGALSFAVQEWLAHHGAASDAPPRAEVSVRETSRARHG